LTKDHCNKAFKSSLKTQGEIHRADTLVGDQQQLFSEPKENKKNAGGPVNVRKQETKATPMQRTPWLEISNSCS
jgi:hypothetical protein